MGIRTVFRTGAAFALGELALYSFDPDRGSARRTRLSSQTAARCRRGLRRSRTAVRYERAKIAGHRAGTSAPPHAAAPARCAGAEQGCRAQPRLNAARSGGFRGYKPAEGETVAQQEPDQPGAAR